MVLLTILDLTIQSGILVVSGIMYSTKTLFNYFRKTNSLEKGIEQRLEILEKKFQELKNNYEETIT